MLINLDFPVNVKCLEFSRNEAGQLPSPRLSRAHLQVDESDFRIDIHNVAIFRVQDGDKVQIYPYENADMESVKLFLNGSALGALFHQKGIMPFHGSAFSINGKGVLICGVSGAGKSSVTAAFCQNGAKFISDDITPVSIHDSIVQMTPLKTNMKLWNDSIKKLNIKNENLEKIRPALDKYYLPFQDNSGINRLDNLVILSTHNKEEFRAVELRGIVKYNNLRNQIYRKVYLKGMPETEKLYFKQLFQIASAIKVTSVQRPRICNIYEVMNFIKCEIDL